MPTGAPPPPDGRRTADHCLAAATPGLPRPVARAPLLPLLCPRGAPPPKARELVLILPASPTSGRWVCLSDRSRYEYVLIDATSLGHGVLLQRVEPPILDDGACARCCSAPCACELLADYGE